MTLLQLIAYLWPAMTLERFEKAYRAMLAQHGPKEAAVIAHAMKATTQALGLRYVAADQAKQQIKDAEAEAVRLEVKNSVASTKLSRKEQKFEQKMRAKRMAAQAKENETRNVIAKHTHRAEKIREIQSIL